MSMRTLAAAGVPREDPPADRRRSAAGRGGESGTDELLLSAPPALEPDKLEAASFILLTKVEATLWANA